MKNIVCRFATLALMGVLATLAHAQSRITLNVPFNFLISDKTFPAGQYSVTSARERLTVQDSDGKTIFMATTNAVSGRHVGPTGEVVFHCYKNQCFLSEFWTPVREYGNQLLPSRYEQEVAKAKHGQRTEFALIGRQSTR